MIILTGDTLNIDEKGVERLVERVFFKSIDLLGGLKKLAEFRTLTWLPSLARAAFAIVLREEYLKPEDEIAEYVGLTRNTVRNILRADPDQAMYKIQHLDELSAQEKKELKVHTAGGVAKLAYRLVKEGQDSQTILDFCHTMAGEALQAASCESPWAYLVLKHTKGIGYPIVSDEVLGERLREISIKGVDGSTVAKGLVYPIKTPAQLLKEIKEYLQAQGK
ncbi:bacterio-opsin activator [Nitratiruptor tergarcus]|uniref:Probable regulatory domain-containing protein n=1 Tax=Nitratiruptor tergarcus DSM 16512 TaxID=1069081 RepID=A0A1W1WQI6_9BACT|nr:bacterio-opsin activator [Nitratiruptor tergarcus]SMC08568.1 probable regulatory domain-containing protein [Nitratiruptor tergarcus DSM 16512]